MSPHVCVDFSAPSSAVTCQPRMLLERQLTFFIFCEW